MWPTSSAVSQARLVAAAFSLATASLVTSCGAIDKLQKKKKAHSSEETPTDEPASGVDTEAPADSEPTQHDPSTGAGTPDSNSLQIILGGFYSCGSDLDGNPDPKKQPLNKLHAAAKEADADAHGGAQPASIISCYGTDPTKMTYVLPDAPDVIMTDTVAAALADFQKVIVSYADPEVTVIGHSYGAYTALAWLRDWGADRKIERLVTIDPISKVGCTPNAVIAAVLASEPLPQGCLEAPSDLSPEDLEKIKSISGQWLNFYQLDSNYLRSGPLAGATNYKLAYEADGLEPHMEVASDQKTLSEVTSAFSKLPADESGP